MKYSRNDVAVIYNLYPRLAGNFEKWNSHIRRAKDMNFNWIFINPVHFPGFSGSIYSIKDYYSFDPKLVNENSDLTPEEQFQDTIDYMHREGLLVIADLVINHTAIDSPLTEEHPEWYKKDEDGKIYNPRVMKGDKIDVIWGDLAEIDNENSKEKTRLWYYWKDLISYLIEFGIDGFRCDAAYQIPSELWKELIDYAKEIKPGVKFFAETLGCTIDKVVELGKAGFDYTFNSSKWWNFKDLWCLSQYWDNENISRSISFAESHDTPRLAFELKDNLDAVKMRYLFSALFSSGVMMPLGFEFGFHKKIDVVKTGAADFEEPNFDLQSYIGEVNRIKMEYSIFQEESHIDLVQSNNSEVVIMKKTSKDWLERALIIINTDIKNYQYIDVNSISEVFQSKAFIKDISPEFRLDYVPDHFEYYLRPAQIIVLYQQEEERAF